MLGRLWTCSQVGCYWSHLLTGDAGILEGRPVHRSYLLKLFPRAHLNKGVLIPRRLNHQRLSTQFLHNSTQSYCENTHNDCGNCLDYWVGFLLSFFAFFACWYSHARRIFQVDSTTPPSKDIPPRCYSFTCIY